MGGIQKDHGWVNYLGYDTSSWVHSGDIFKILTIEYIMVISLRNCKILENVFLNNFWSWMFGVMDCMDL